jgi:hypothetical protein
MSNWAVSRSRDGSPFCLGLRRQRVELISFLDSGCSMLIDGTNPPRLMGRWLRCAASTNMRNAHHAGYFSERLRLHCASLLFLVAKSILLLTRRLFRIPLLDIAGYKYGIRASEMVDHLGSRLVRRKPR